MASAHKCVFHKWIDMHSRSPRNHHCVSTACLRITWQNHHLPCWKEKPQHHAALPFCLPSTRKQSKGTGKYLTSIISEWDQTQKTRPPIERGRSTTACDPAASRSCDVPHHSARAPPLSIQRRPEDSRKI